MTVRCPGPAGCLVALESALRDEYEEPTAAELNALRRLGCSNPGELWCLLGQQERAHVRAVMLLLVNDRLRRSPK